MPKIIKVERKEGKVIANNRSDGNLGNKLSMDGIQKWYRGNTDQVGLAPLILSAIGSSIMVCLFFALFSYFYCDKDIDKVLGLFGWAMALNIMTISIWIPFGAYILAFYMLFTGNNVMIQFFGLEHSLLTNTIFMIWFVGIIIGQSLILMIYAFEKKNQIDRKRQKQRNMEKYMKNLGDGVKGSKSLTWYLLLIGLLILGSFLIGIPIYSWVKNSTLSSEEIYMIVGGILVVVGGMIALWLYTRKSEK